jgi:predicted DNA-binding transcriptional regulator YafY
MFTQDEAKALVASVRLAQSWLDPALARSAQEALGKILPVLPADARAVIRYTDLAERPSERTLRPLGCFYWGKVWTLAAWCEQRNDFRSFRIDRVGPVQSLDERFRDEPGRTLADLARLNGARLQDEGGAVQLVAAR